MMGEKRVYDGDFIIHQFSVKNENRCMMVYDGVGWVYDELLNHTPTSH